MTCGTPWKRVRFRHGKWRACRVLPAEYANCNQGIKSAGFVLRQGATGSCRIACICLAAAVMASGAVHADNARIVPALPALNFAHFNHLVSTAVIAGKTVDVLNIYSSAPDFAYVAAPDEGYACVDDAARGIILLSAALDAGTDPGKQRQLELLTEFVLTMQSDNGYFNNFIQTNGTINTSYRTSVADLDWWSLRALWGLEAAYRHLPQGSDLVRQVVASTERLVGNLKRDLPNGPHKPRHGDGLEVPDWLPSGSGADKAAVAVIGLLSYYARTHDPQALALITSLADGIMAMQVGDARHFPYDVHLSWRNTWHAWGSDQAYALLLAGQQLKHPEYTASGLAEIDHYYPYLLKRGYLGGLTVGKVNGRYVELHADRYPQIAYGIRPMVFAADEAWRLTGREHYRAIARRFATWLTGSNIAHRALYDPASGRVADGIVSHATINPNSGAESTLEGLLALQRLQ